MKITRKLAIGATAFLVALLSNGYTKDSYKVVAKTEEVGQLLANSPIQQEPKARMISEEELIETASYEVETEVEQKKTELEVCAHNLFYAYMYASAVTDVNSNQYKLIQESYVGNYGIYMKDGAYLVAMGTKYAQYVGQRFEVTFENENTIQVIIGDVKQDVHTRNGNRCTGINTTDILEFIVSNSLDETARNWGSLHAIEEFNSLVVSIRSIE